MVLTDKNSYSGVEYDIPLLDPGKPCCSWCPSFIFYMKQRTGLIFLCCIVSSLYGLVTLLAPPPYGVLTSNKVNVLNENSDGCQNDLSHCICPRETICADSLQEMIYLMIARLSVYTVYPYILLMFLTKANNLMANLQRRVYSVYFDFGRTHYTHKFGGRMVEFASWVHVLFHLIRLGQRREWFILWDTRTGVTGLIAIFLTPLITWPMKIKCMKTRIRYEYRKASHYLSWVRGIAMIFHAPPTNIFWTVGAAFLIYVLDYLVGVNSGTFLLESTTFRRFSTGTLLSFENPKGFELHSASYVLIMLPWLGKYEWHAFSVFPDPHHNLQTRSCVCIEAVGDWTKKLHYSIKKPTSRAAWISGPFLSPFAADYDNVISVATGIGISPALAVLDRFKNTARRINLIWMCRDASLLEFFLPIIDFPEDAFIFIFYTGRCKLNLNQEVPPNMFIFKSRPNLHNVVTTIVNVIENETLLPEFVYTEGKRFRELVSRGKVTALASRIVEDYDLEGFSESCAVDVAGDVIEVSKINTKDQEDTTDMTTLHKAELAVTKENFINTVQDYFGEEKFPISTVDAMFDDIDIDKNGVIDEAEFFDVLSKLDEAIIEGKKTDADSDIPLEEVEAGNQPVHSDLTKSMRIMRRISRESTEMFSTFTSPEVVCNLNVTSSTNMKTWLLQYCGGSAPVIKTLKDIQYKCNIDLEIENFDW